MNDTLRWFFVVATLLSVYPYLPILQPEDIHMIGIWLGRYLQSDLSNTDTLSVLIQHVTALLCKTDNGLLLKTVVEIVIAIGGYSLIKSLRSK